MKLLRQIVLLPLLFTGSLAFAQTDSEIQRFLQLAPESFVSVGAEAYREIREDRANVTLTKQLDGDDQRTLMREINLAMRNVVELGKGNTELELETGNYAIRRNVHYIKDSKEIDKITYTATGQVIVRSKNFDELLSFVEAAHDDMLVGSISFDLSTDLRRAIEKEILEEGLGYDGFEVRNIEVKDSESGSIIRPVRNATMALSASAESAASPSAAPPLEGGKQIVRVSVSGQVVLK